MNYSLLIQSFNQQLKEDKHIIGIRKKSLTIKNIPLDYQKEPGTEYEKACPKCEKYFTFTVSYIPFYDVQCELNPGDMEAW